MSNSKPSEGPQVDGPKNSNVRRAPRPEDGARDIAFATAATVGVAAVGVVVFEATLLPGLILGAAAALAPQYAPKLGSALRPRKAGAQGPTLSQLGAWTELIFQGTKILSYAHRTYNLLGRGPRFR